MSKKSEEILADLKRNEPLTADEERVLIHEAGHGFQAYKSGLESAEIALGVNNGACIHANGTRSINAMVACSGLSAELINEGRLTRENRREVFDEIVKSGEYLKKTSPQDREGWNPAIGSGQAYEAFYWATGRLLDDWEIVKHMAKQLGETCSEIIRASRLDPAAGDRAWEAFRKTRVIEVARMAARGEDVSELTGEVVTARAEDDPNLFWVTAIQPPKFRKQR